MALNRVRYFVWTMACAIMPSIAFAAPPSVEECLTASDQSILFNRSHQLRAELNELVICSSESCPSDIRVECSKRADQTSQALPSMVFEAKDANGNDLTSVQVLMDGETLATKLDGTAIAVDPGEHTFEFRVDGAPPLQKVFVIRVSEKNRREKVTLGQPAPSAPPARATRNVAAPPLLAEPDSSPRGLGAQRIGAITAAGAGLVGVAIGGVFGVQAYSRKQRAQTICPEPTCESIDGVNQWDAAAKSGTLSTIAFVMGGVGLASAAALWFTAPAHHATQVGLGIGGLQLRGAW